MDAIHMLYDALKVGAGALGAILIGLYKARNDSEKNIGKERSEFTGHLMERLAQVESSLAREREYYEVRLKEQAQMYKQVIVSLEKRIAHLEEVTQCEST